MEKTIKLTVEQAQGLYKQNPEIRGTILSDFTDVELGITPKLKDWKDCFNDNDIYYYIDTDSEIIKTYIEEQFLKCKDRNLTTTKKHAKSMLAFAQLNVLMDDLEEECDLDWSSDIVTKYVIRRKGNEIKTDYWYTNYHFLAFKTKKVRDAFLEKHRKLIEEYFML